MNRFVFLAIALSFTLIPAVGAEGRAPHAAKGYAAPGVTESVLYAFRGSTQLDGAGPRGLLYMAHNGTLFGATAGGGVNAGVDFQLAPSSSGYAESVLYRFSGGTDGGSPEGRFVADGSGTLYDVTDYDFGTVYALRPTASGYAQSTLFHGGSDGKFGTPIGPVATGAGGSVLVSLWSVPYGKHTSIIALQPGVSGDNPEKLLAFPGYGCSPVGLNAGRNGTILLVNAGPPVPPGQTVVYKLARTVSGYSKRAIYQIPVHTYPNGELIEGPSGTIYGTTFRTIPSPNSLGSVFALVPHGDTYEASTLYGFTRAGKVGWPQSGLALDAAGNIYGTAERGAAYGLVFELQRVGAGYKLVILYEFAGNSAADGADPSSGLISDGKGSLYGMTFAGGGAGCGHMGCGTVYRITLPASH